MLDGSTIEKKNALADYSFSEIQKLQLKVTENRNIYWFTCTRVYSRKAIGNLRFDDKVKMGSDIIFNISFLNNARCLSIVPDCPYNYYETLNSITSSQYKPALLASMEAHYTARVEAHIWPNSLIDKQVLLADFARSYVEHMLPYLLNNLAYLAIDKRYKELVKIRNSFIYETCIANYDGYHPVRGIRSLIKCFSQHSYLATLGLLQLSWTKQKVKSYA